MSGMAGIHAALLNDVERAHSSLLNARALVQQRQHEHQWALDGENIARGIRDRNRNREDLEDQYYTARNEQLDARDRLRQAEQEENRKQQEHDDAVRALNAFQANQ